MKDRGLIQPLVVRAATGKTDACEIIAGERRWRAAQRAGLHEVPIAVVEATVAGHLWVGAVIAAVTAVSYAAPVWESRWQAILAAAGDEAVLLHGLEVPMSTFLRRCPSTASIQARVLRLERGVAWPAVGVVQAPA